MDRVSASGAEERSSSLRGGAHQPPAGKREAVFVLHYNSWVRNNLLIVLTLLLVSCTAQVDVEGAVTPTARIPSPTLTPSRPAPSQTPLPTLLRATPTVDPVEGVTSTQVNVRSEPSTIGEVIGILPPNSTVHVIGKDPGENWWQIQYPQGEDGEGWVAAEFVQVTQGGEVAVVGGDGSGVEGAITAIVQQQINIRSGPGTSFNSLGTLNPQDVITLTGKDTNGAWLQIDFPAGPEGKGWVNAAFVQADSVDALPIVAEDNVVVGTGTPTQTPFAAEPTVVPARADGDSAVSPAVNVSLTNSGTRLFQYSSDVSSPDGDAEDWMQFTTFTQFLRIELECEGSISYVAELLQNNSVVQNLVCDRIILISLDPEAVYAVHFQSAPAGGLQYTRFTLRVEAMR